MKVVSLRALNRATLARQMLLERESVQPLTVIERLVGMQAQVPKPPFIGLWTRLQDFARRDLQTLIDKREVVRATMMRATIHLMTRKDYLAYRSTIQAALAGGVQRFAGAESPRLDAVMAEAEAFFARTPCTFDALREHLAGLYPDADHRALAYAARLRLHLVQVPIAHRWSYPASCDFMLAREFLGESPDSADRITALALRYLAAFGPATAADMQNWSALPSPSVKAAFAELRPQLIVLRDEKDRELFDLPGAPRPDEETAAPVRFLPEYDNVLLGHADRSRIITEEHRKRIATANLRILATFLVDGRVAGSWTSTRTKNAATLEMSPFLSLTAAQKEALREEGERLLRFVEDDATKFTVKVGRKS